MIEMIIKQKDVIINGKRLDVILEEHKHWLAEDCDGWCDMRANLMNADLSEVDMSDANLSYVKMQSAKLQHAKLNGANLRGAELTGSDLYNADLHGANLYSAMLDCCNFTFTNLIKANLYGANLRGSRLHGTYLYCADLRKADLANAHLSSADLDYADLNGTNFDYASLQHAHFNGAKGPLIEYRKGKILTEAIIGYKKCDENVIVTLEIPKGAIVFSINGKACRTNKAKVIAIDGADRAKSLYKYKKLSYYVGDEFNIYNFNCEYNIECSTGIHFFMTREEAEKYC